MCANVLGFVITLVIIFIVLGIFLGDPSKEGIERLIIDDKRSKELPQIPMWAFDFIFSMVVWIIMHSCCDVDK